MTPTYVIACDELPDRKAAAVDHLTARLGPNGFRVWRGIHGRTWGLETTREFEPGRRISPGHVGLNLGHWTLWNHLYHSTRFDDQMFLVLEDDAVLPPDWHAALGAVMGDLYRAFYREGAAYPHWEFVFVGLAETEPHVWHKVTARVGGPDSRLCRIADPFGTHAYLVRRSALPVLIDRMCAAERNMDQQLYRNVLRDDRVTWAAVLPTLVRQRTFDYDNAGRPEWAASTVDAAAPDGTVRTPGGPPPPIVVRDDDRSGRPAPDLYAATSALIDPFPCFYRGEYLDGPGRAVRPSDAKRVTVPVSLCARLNRPCHSKPSADLGAVMVDADHGPPAAAVDCDTCALRPDPGTAAKPRLDVPDAHFNPSVFLHHGRLVLATRDSWGHSKVALWHLDNEHADWSGRWAVTPIGSYGSAHPDAPRLEDPRLFHDHLGRPCATLNLPDKYPPKYVRVGYVRFAADLSGVEETVVFPSPKGNLYEKNWVPFPYGNGLRWVYAGKPVHVVLDPLTGETESTVNPFPWTGGAVRGGAAPVLAPCGACGGAGVLGGHSVCGACNGFRKVYYHFFHGCLKRLQGSVYSVGCMTFEPYPPFRVLRQTPTPLVWPDPADNRDDVVKRFVVWPGGAVFNPTAGAWFLAVGVNDTFCRIIKLPSEQIESSLSSVPETESPPIGISNTPVVKGVRPD